ncbi:hypothetical protein ACIRPK_26355 [Kitasatospora sp. NPDC101801]|uniref:hypothetical protein n=1 Tax=Kitasatospora sp. NPDC101801 TaxID=3364103 RepID=UPI0038036366
MSTELIERATPTGALPGRVRPLAAEPGSGAHRSGPGGRPRPFDAFERRTEEFSV